MVHFEKTFSEEIEMALEREKKKRSGTYRLDIVVKQLREDFKNKCYLCEQEGITSINTEHFIPHKGDIDLKFDWKNLFFVCTHCNNTKLAKPEYANILNCTNPTHKVTSWIKYEIVAVPKFTVQISVTYSLTNDYIIKNTAKLLHEIYNKSDTITKLIETENLRKAILKELIVFSELLNDYYIEDLDEMDKEICGCLTFFVVIMKKCHFRRGLPRQTPTNHKKCHRTKFVSKKYKDI